MDKRDAKLLRVLEEIKSAVDGVSKEFESLSRGDQPKYFNTDGIASAIDALEKELKQGAASPRDPNRPDPQPKETVISMDPASTKVRGRW